MSLLVVRARTGWRSILDICLSIREIVGSDGRAGGRRRAARDTYVAHSYESPDAHQLHVLFGAHCMYTLEQFYLVSTRFTFAARVQLATVQTNPITGPSALFFLPRALIN